MLLRTAARSMATAVAPAPDVSITINGKRVSVRSDWNVIQAARTHGFDIPSLCYHPMLRVTGSCRVCLVEDCTANNKLVPACNTRVYEGQVIETQSARVDASVTGALGMLRCKHPNECMTCNANGTCEFQRLCHLYRVPEFLPQLHSRRAGAHRDNSSPSVSIDTDKCVMCTRCVRACDDVQGMHILGEVARGSERHIGTVGDVPLADTACISCGQCTAVCPVGAIEEQRHDHQVRRLLQNRRGKILVAQTAPAVRVTLGEEFDCEPGTVKTPQMVAALRALGFDYVFDTQFSADVTVLEESAEFLRRVATPGSVMPLFTSCCPAWINLAEKSYGDALLPHLSTCKSPQAMLSTLIRTHWAQRMNIDPDNIVIVSVMPCVAKKDEIQRPALRRTRSDGTLAPETDFVLTARELARLIKDERIRFHTLASSDFDNPLGSSTGAGALFAASGGVAEAVLRTVHYRITGQDLTTIPALRPITNMPGAREIRDLRVGDRTVSVAVVTGTKQIRAVVDRVLAGDRTYDLIEVMACPGGCIGGGGAPRNAIDLDILAKRVAAVHRIDEGKPIRQSHRNSEAVELVALLPNRHVLHTQYRDRRADVRARSDEPWGHQQQ